MAERTRHLIIFAIVTLALLSLSRPAAACSCIGTRPACQAFWDPGAVFAGKVVSIEPQATDGVPSFGDRRVRFEVGEAFSGVTTAVVDVYTGQGGGDCGYAFAVGASYLVYAYQAPGTPRLTTGICSRTRLMSKAAEDLAYLRTLTTTGALGATITGSVHHRDRNIATQPRVTILAPVASLDIVMECEGAAYRGTTDANGRFTIAGVPVGWCTPRLESPGADFLVTVDRINIPDPRSCADVDLLVGTRRQ